jgi:hypothetical protein
MTIRSFGRTTVALPPAIPTRSLARTATAPITYGVSKRNDPLHRPRAEVVHEKKQLQELTKAATITRRVGYTHICILCIHLWL